MTTHHHTFLQYVNLKDIEDQIQQLQSQLRNYKSQLSNNTYILYELQINYLTDKIGKVSNQLQSLEPNRIKRGLVDSLGSVVKSITGNLDYTDALKYNHAINMLQSNQNKLANEFNDQITLNKEWMSKSNNVLTQLIENQIKINETLKLLLNETDRTDNLIKYTKFGQILAIISNNVEDLMLELIKIENTLAFTRASSTHHSSLDIDTLRTMVNRLEKIYGKDVILRLELREYYNIISPGSYFNEKQIVIVFRFPIVSKDIFNLYKLSIVPNKNQQALIPTYPFIATNDRSFVYIEAECSKYNNWYLCEKEVTHQIRTKSDCIHELISNQALQESCQFTTVFLTKETMEKLDDQHYILSFPHPTKIQLVCGREDFISLQGSYLVTIPTSCYLRTPELTLVNDNDEIQGQPLKLMNIPYDAEKHATASNHIYLNSINLRGLHNIQSKIMVRQPIQLENAQSDVLYHTTIPFYVVMMSITVLAIALLSHRYRHLFCKDTPKSITQDHIYTVPEKKEDHMSENRDQATEDHMSRDKVPATFALRVLK